jgi:hypothetical protein
MPVAAAIVGTSMLGGCASDSGARWWKGNLHTHSLWSDGDEYPEVIVDWYKSAGYDFVALSDHNTLAVGDRWIDAAGSAGGLGALEGYSARFGEEWVERRDDNGTLEVRLRTLEEYRVLFEEPGRFLVIQSEEITDRFQSKSVHVNATNIVDLIPPQGGGSVVEVMQNNVDAVIAQRRATGQAMFPHINHPNFGWSITAEDLIAVQRERFFEVYNGHPAVNTDGDDLRPSTERLWDIVLAERLRQGREVMFGIATDDAHNYHEYDDNHSNPGRGWVMVRAPALAPEEIIAAMEAGDFYGSSGVVLEGIEFAGGTLTLQVQAEEGVAYTTQFVGTRAGYPTAEAEAMVGESASVTRRYSDEIGVVFAEVAGTSPAYTVTGDELYVRAKVISSKRKANPYRAGEVEVAWTQPVVIRR